MAPCTARALVFSGRPDPTWLVEEHQSQQLEVLWDQLQRAATPMPSPPRVGYRGVSMVCGPSHPAYFAFAGYVKRQVGNTVAWKQDQARRFERLVLASAPPGLLPAGILEDLT